MRINEVTKRPATNPILKEGGNAFKGNHKTVRIDKKDVLPTVRFLESITDMPLIANMLGSTGIKETSGDLDLAVDSNKYSKDELVAKLMMWSESHDPTALVRKIGYSVHFRCPINGIPGYKYVQADLMFIPDPEFSKWSMRPSENTKYQNSIRNIILASIAKFYGLKWSMLTGLSTREGIVSTHRKAGSLNKLGRNPAEISKILFGPKSAPDTADTVENILAALEIDPQRDEKMKEANDTIESKGLIL
jgi:hypothetical protein